MQGLHDEGLGLHYSGQAWCTGTSHLCNN